MIGLPSHCNSVHRTFGLFLLLLAARDLGVARGFSGNTVPTVLVKCVSSSSSGSRKAFVRRPLMFAAKSSGPSTPPSCVPNEFSRPLNTDRILKTASGKQRRSHRNYETTIEANEDECSALAGRFGIKSLECLKADLSLSLPSSGAQGAGGGRVLTVQVEGTIAASLTQRCVRTNEAFDMKVEIPISVIVKPVSMNFQWQGADDDSEDETPSSASNKSNKKKPKKNLQLDRSLNLSGDMTELQQLINQQQEEIVFGIDDILEDESIYSLATGNLDIGELVAQTFWLNLDPYPKKPGSGPVEFTISG